MTGTTAAQTALLERIIEVGPDRTIRVTAFFEGVPGPFTIYKPDRINGVLQFVTDDDLTVRIREDLLLGICEESVI